MSGSAAVRGQAILRSDRPRFSLRIDLRVPLVLLVLTAVTAVGLVLHVSVGSFAIAPDDVVRALLGSGTPEQDFIVRTLRLPRALVAFAVGAGFAVAGAILQGVTRNPLASPDILGLTSGASLGAVAVIVVLPADPTATATGSFVAPTLPLSALPFFAFLGAAIAGACTYSLAWKGRSSSPIRLILVGIGIAAVAQAFVSLILATSPRFLGVANAVTWLVGTVYAKNWQHLLPLLAWLAVLLPFVAVSSRHINLLQMGDEVARGMGATVERWRLALLIASVAIVGACTATAGPVAFVGLMAPHIARRLVGPLHGGLVPTAAMVGGAVVVVADLAARGLFAPIDIPVGVVTAAVGAPYLIVLLWRTRNV